MVQCLLQGDPVPALGLDATCLLTPIFVLAMIATAFIASAAGNVLTPPK